MSRASTGFLVSALIMGFALMLVAPGPRKPQDHPVQTPQTASVTVSEAEPPPAPPEPAEPPEPDWRPLASYETRFKATEEYQGRVHNISKLVQWLDGIIVDVGEVVSFNAKIGPRDEKGGFREAPTYLMGEIRPGMGGGTCQVSSTLYAALAHANVEILDRRPHSRISNYIPAGLDATVNYPEECWGKFKAPDKDPPHDKEAFESTGDPRICYDLRFRNNYDFPLSLDMVIGDLNEDGKRSLTITIKGWGEVPKVTSEWRVYSTSPFKSRYRTVVWWKDARKRLKQSGIVGVTGARVFTLEWPDGRTETKKVHSRYIPAPEVWHVGEAFEKPEENQEGTP